jgi:hypothetical protein
MPRVENERIVVGTNAVRAGVTGHNVRYVLLIGIIAVISCLFSLTSRPGVLGAATLLIWAAMLWRGMSRSTVLPGPTSPAE